MLANCSKSEYNILMTHAVPYIPYLIPSVSLATQLGTCAKCMPKQKATMLYIPYIGNHSWKKTFVNFVDFGMIVDVFLLPFFTFQLS